MSVGLLSYYSSLSAAESLDASGFLGDAGGLSYLEGTPFRIPDTTNELKIACTNCLLPSTPNSKMICISQVVTLSSSFR